MELITGVNAPTTELLIQMLEDMVIGHHKVESFTEFRTPCKKSLEEWYNDSVNNMLAGKEMHGYKLYSGDEDFPSETLLTFISKGYIRVQSSIQ